MRAGQFTDSYLPIVNGVSTLIHLFKRTLEKLGHAPYLFTFGYTGRADAEPNIIRSRGWPIGRTGYYAGLSYSRQAWSIARTMDVLHTHHPFQSGALAARLSGQTGKPLVFTNHTRYDLYARHYLPFLPEPAARAFLGAWLRRFGRRCDLIVAVSAAAKSMLDTFRVSAPIDIVPNGIELERFADAAPAGRSALGLPQEAVVFMYIGRLGPEKNLTMLLDAFAQAARRTPHIALALVGGGPLDAALRHHARSLNLADRIRLLGAFPNEHIPSILGAADAFVTASLTESHPLTLVEALAGGRPAIGFKAPGIQETIVDGDNGLLAHPDPAALGECMSRLALDADLRACLSDGARRTAQQYSIETTTRRMVEHYERLLREKRNDRP